jgi:hypothetical protein
MPRFSPATPKPHVCGMNPNHTLAAGRLALVGSILYGIISGLATVLAPLTALHPVASPVLFTLFIVVLLLGLASSCALLRWLAGQ